MGVTDPPPLGRPWQKDLEFKDSLSYIGSPVSKIRTKITQNAN